jgi:bacterioferritin-associated ferredoxin
VNDQRIREEIANGALTLEQIAARCGAGSRCGGCIDTVRELLVEIRPVSSAA